MDNSSPAAAEAPTPPARPSSSPGPLEPQSSTIKSEVMPSSPVVIHHVQSSPVHIRQSQQSAALTAQPSPPLTPSPTPSKSQDLARGGGASDPPSPAHHKKTQGNPVNNGNGPAPQGLVIEELQTSREKSKDRAMSIKVDSVTLLNLLKHIYSGFRCFQRCEAGDLVNVNLVTAFKAPAINKDF